MKICYAELAYQSPDLTKACFLSAFTRSFLHGRAFEGFNTQVRNPDALFPIARTFPKYQSPDSILKPQKKKRSNRSSLCQLYEKNDLSSQFFHTQFFPADYKTSTAH